MKDYSNIGLTPYLQKDNSLAARDSGFVGNYKLSQNYSYPTEALRYTNMNRLSRPYMAVCTPQGEGGTFKDIQKAVNYVNELGGGNVLLRAGEYRPGKDIDLYSNIKLVGEGPGLSIINLNGAYRIKFVGTSADFSLLVGFADNAKQEMGISNLCVKNSTYDTLNEEGAVFLKYVRNAIIENCMFKDNALDVNMITCFPGIIRDCTSSSSTAGFKINGGIGRCLNNTISETTNTSIHLLGNGVCENNYIEKCDIGIDIEEGTYIVVHGNYIKTAGTYGIRTQGANMGCRISNNIIIDGSTGTAGLTIDGNYVNVNNNYIEEGFSYGIRIALCNNAQVIGNSVNAGGSGTALYITSEANRTIYSSNDLLDAATAVTNSGTATTAGTNITS